MGKHKINAVLCEAVKRVRVWDDITHIVVIVFDMGFWLDCADRGRRYRASNCRMRQLKELVFLKLGPQSVSRIGNSLENSSPPVYPEPVNTSCHALAGLRVKNPIIKVLPTGRSVCMVHWGCCNSVHFNYWCFRVSDRNAGSLHASSCSLPVPFVSSVSAWTAYG